MRIRQMDGLRAVAALAVVMIHVSAGRMNPVGVSCNQAARFAVPLFIMLSGYGHMHSWLQHSGQSAVQTAKRRLKRVLPAYLVWSVLYLAVDAVFGKPHAHPIKNILTGGSYVHLCGRAASGGDAAPVRRPDLRYGDSPLPTDRRSAAVAVSGGADRSVRVLAAVLQHRCMAGEIRPE